MWRASVLSAKRTATVRRALLQWFDLGHREMPWRETRDPWAIWVSEIMLQQTRVESVMPYFVRFMGRFPTPLALAESPIDEVLTFWAGLGYYSRARNLHRAAGLVVSRFGGLVPDDEGLLRELPGVGPYTCGAILSIAFEKAVPAIDGNVQRVLARLDARAGDIRRGAAKLALEAQARALVAGPLPGRFNQALMELGATVCKPRSPECPRCPLRADCLGYAAAEQHLYPSPLRRAPRPISHYVAALLVDADHVYVRRRPDTGLLAGLWELPMVESTDRDALTDLGLEVWAADSPSASSDLEVEQAFTHRVWRLRIVQTVKLRAGVPPSGWLRLPTHALETVALTGPTLKALWAAGIKGAPARRGAGRARAH
ncbi:MAG: A/G-specific adenine glycosylase [Myxococcales bacterium]|nr:A/G-specific adenine glycosylase [Myxococcales bacterium]